MRCSAPPTARRADLAAAVDTGLASGAFDDAFVAQAELALLAAQQGAWDEAGRHARQAQALVEETASATTWRARSCMLRWHASPSTKEGSPMPARH